MKLQMSNTSIPERWNSTKQLKLLFVCAQRLKDCEMNISRVARGDQNLICLGTAHKCNETHNT